MSADQHNPGTQKRFSAETRKPNVCRWRVEDASAPSRRSTRSSVGRYPTRPPHDACGDTATGRPSGARPRCLGRCRQKRPLQRSTCLVASPGRLVSHWGYCKAPHSLPYDPYAAHWQQMARWVPVSLLLWKWASQTTPACFLNRYPQSLAM